MDKQALKRGVLDSFRSIIFSLLFSMLLVLVLALIAKATPLDATTATVLNQIIKVLSVFLGVFLGLKGKRGGFLIGLIAGLFFTLFSWLIFSAISGSLSFDQITVYDFLIGAASGAISGILTVNLKSIERKRGNRPSIRRRRTVAK